jgi:hypothetical protein
MNEALDFVGVCVAEPVISWQFLGERGATGGWSVTASVRG